MSDNVFFKNKIILINSMMSVLIVLAHSENLGHYHNLQWKLTTFLEKFMFYGVGRIALSMFLLMASILFFQNYNWDKVMEKYKSRIKSVVVPYFLWNILYYLFFIVMTNVPFTRNLIATKQVAIDGPTIINAVFFHQFNSVYWFMYQMILFVGISPLVYAIAKCKYGFLLPIGCIVLNYWFFTIPVCENGLRVDSLIFWTLGAYLAVHHKEKMYQKNNKAMIYLILSLILALIRYYLECVCNMNGEGGVLNALLVVNVVITWFAMDAFKMKRVSEWMTMSFFVYSLHPLIVDVIKKVLIMLLPDNDIMALLNFILTAVGSVALCCVVAKVIICFLPGVYDILSGGRLKKVKQKQ